MEAYKKPVIASENSARGVFPAVAAAFATGVGIGLARGRTMIDSTHTQALPRKKTQD